MNLSDIKIEVNDKNYLVISIYHKQHGNVKLLYSYQTLVAVCYGKQLDQNYDNYGLVSGQKWSNTTSKHINLFCQEYSLDRKTKTVSAEEFQSFVSEFNL